MEDSVYQHNLSTWDFLISYLIKAKGKSVFLSIHRRNFVLDKVNYSYQAVLNCVDSKNDFKIV